MNQQVSVVRCADYELDQVEAALRKNLDLLGGIERFVKPGQRVCLKVNLLSAARPEQAVTTHPVLIEAMANLVREAGAQPFVADSPGGIAHTPGALRRVYRATGLLDLAERTGIALNWDTTAVQVSLPKGKLIKRLDVIKPVLDADVVIAMPKLKTHIYTTFTGATKILFGVVPGLTKAGYHAKLADQGRFAEMLLDIVAYVQPALFVMDGVVGLEGDGPGLHGEPRHVGLILASPDAAALDVTACRVIGIDPGNVPTLQAARTRGWWNGHRDIETLGHQVEEVRIADFELAQPNFFRESGLANLSFFQKLLRPLFKPGLTPRVSPQRARCTACRTCVRSCPQDAISIVDKLAVVDDDACIRCYCCHELCPEAAIELEFSRLGRFIRWSGGMGNLETATTS
jgi:uncharacterized protein (DUF362 family)/ferredoxin